MVNKDSDEILCVPVFFWKTREEVFVPFREYKSSPDPDSFIVRDRRKTRDPKLTTNPQLNTIRPTA